MDSNRLAGLSFVNVFGDHVLGRGDGVQRAVVADTVEPGDPGQGGELYVVDGLEAVRAFTKQPRPGHPLPREDP